jgi:multidrug resistance efflux pump
MPMSGNSSARAISVPLIPAIEGVKLPPFALSRRALKIAFAIALCSAGAFGMLSESSYISTSNAVVSAHIIDVRTPIEGTVSGLVLASGNSVERGELLGIVNDPRSDHEHLDELRILESSALSTVDALTAEQTALQAQQHALLFRSKLHSSAVSSRLQQQAIEAGRTLSGLKVALGLANSEFRRGEQLHDAGILADADFDRLHSAQLIAVEVVAAQESNLINLRGQATDASNGLLSESGDTSDVSYSRQRADEIAIRLAANSGSLAIALGQSREAHINVEAETVRGDLMHQSEVRSPIQGFLWKLDTTNGEHTLSGAALLSMVDCNQQFVLAQVPQDRVPDIAAHKEARVRLAGESEERAGTVLSVSGDILKLPDAQLAALPFLESSQQKATVWIGLNTPVTPTGPGSPVRSASRADASCIIGRSARVLIPTFSTNLATRWFHDLF